MPSKTEEYLALAQRTANGLTRYWESWTDYLTTASRLYKYPFADQLMIYAQRPDATACAEFDIWRNRMNRYVRRGSKGIALLDESSGFPRLHYVFDVSDTGVRRNSRDPEMWQYNDDLKQPVSEMLSKTYGISGERVSQQLADVAGKLVADYWDNNGGDIRAIVDGSLLMDYDEAGVEMQFKSAAAISVTYTLLERCGIEPAGWFDKDDFQAIYNFSTPDSVYALGAAVSDMSREVLRNIERTVKTTIRRRNAERSQYEYEQQERDLLDRRGLPAPEPNPEPAPEAAGQVRQAAPDVPDAESPGAVQHDAPEREPVPAPDGGGADGREPDAADHEAASETEPGPGQGAESDGVGAAHEQPAGTVRGTGADGTDLQLSFFDAHIPTEAEQIETIDRAESEKTPSAFVLSQAEIENELRKHGSGFTGGKQRIMALYQTQPDRKLRAKALAKEYGIGGHSHDYLDGSRGFVNHDGRGMEFDHYPEHKKFTLSWTQVEKYIDLMIQSDRYLTDKEKEHYTPPVSAEPDATLTHAKNLIREFCQEEYDSEPDFSDLSKIGVAYTNATDENIPIQVNVDLVGYRVERYLGEVLIDERQYESLEELTETELEALDFSELVSVTDEELEHYHNKAEEHSALLPLDAATEYNTLKEQHPDALVGFEQGGQFEFYGEDARKVCELVGGKLLEKETELGTVPVTGFPRDQWAYRAKQLWQCGENIYLAGLNEDGTHHQTKYLRREDYLPLGATIHMEGRAFRVDTVNFDKGSVSLQDVALAEMRIPVFREEPLALVRELYEEQDMMESPLPDYKVGDNVVVELPTRTIEGKVGYVGETDVRIDTSTHGQSWDNEVINLYCADCGRRLTLQTHYSKKDGSTQYSYRCGGYASRVNGCTAHSISADNVEALILASVKRFSRFVLKDEETFALELQSLWKEKREEKPKQNQSELKRCQKRYDELSALIRSLYENLMSGLLPERQYKQLMAQYDSEQAELESQMETMKSEIAEDKSSSADIRHFISLIRKCKNPTEISDSMFNELVDKIVVYEAEGAGNARTQKVDIYFNYVGQVDIAYTEEELAELKAQKEQEEQQRMEKQRKREKAYREKRKAKKIAENGGEIIKTKTCPHCGKEFTPTSNRQLFCSRDCWNQARQEQKEAAREAERGGHYYRQRTCAVCGHSYWPTHSQQEFCPDECRRINHNRKTLEFYHKKKGNPKPDPEAVPTPKPKEDNAA